MSEQKSKMFVRSDAVKYNNQVINANFVNVSVDSLTLVIYKGVIIIGVKGALIKIFGADH